MQRVWRSPDGGSSIVGWNESRYGKPWRGITEWNYLNKVRPKSATFNEIMKYWFGNWPRLFAFKKNPFVLDYFYWSYLLWCVHYDK